MKYLIRLAFGVPLIIFIILKLTGVIAWNWFWVLSPAWIYLQLFLLALLVLIAITYYFGLTLRNKL